MVNNLNKNCNNHNNIFHRTIVFIIMALLDAGLSSFQIIFICKRIYHYRNKVRSGDINFKNLENVIYNELGLRKNRRGEFDFRNSKT